MSIKTKLQELEVKAIMKQQEMKEIQNNIDNNNPNVKKAKIGTAALLIGLIIMAITIIAKLKGAYL